MRPPPGWPTPDWGKTEAWVVVEAPPGSLIYAGLNPGVDRQALAAAVGDRRCQDCLHSFAARAGDCVFLPTGTVHALGAGLLVAEIQQSSDATFRLFDWNRVGPDGQPRPLHVEQALEAVDYLRGPLSPIRPKPTDRPEAVRLVECDKFVPGPLGNRFAGPSRRRRPLSHPCGAGGHAAH